MNNELRHYGIPQMKWGIRRFQNPDGTLTPAGKQRYYKTQSKIAAKDAKEYARAKMYYGEGAGTRRKLINNTVKERSKDDIYKEAFEKALANQNMADHAAKAKAERRRTDTKNTASKTGRGLINILNGNPQAASAGAIAIAATVGGAVVLHKKGVDRIVINAAKNKFSDIVDAAQTARGRAEVAKWINNVKQ